MISRRSFLRHASLLSLSPLVLKAAQGQDDSLDEVDWDEPEYHKTFSSDLIRVLQGATNEKSTVISVIAHRSMKMQFEVKDSNGGFISFESEVKDLQLGAFIVHKIFVEGLSLNEEYTLMSWNQTLDRRQENRFRSLDWVNPSNKIAVLTCSNHRDRKSKHQMLRQLFKEKPDVIFFAGDLVYANSVLDTIRGRPAKPRDAYNVYIKTIMEFQLYGKKKLTPLFTTWDDHDLAFNNCDIHHPYKKTMMEVFRSFFPVSPKIEGLRHGPGIAFSFEAFGMQIFFLDGRTYKNNRTQDLLGSDQSEWLLKELQESSKPILLISPQQFWSYRKLAESFQKNANPEFGRLLKALKSLSRPAIFLSGDVHYSQIQEIPSSVLGYKTYEITSSAFFSSSARNYGRRGERQGQMAYYGYPNFLILERIESQSDTLKVNVRCVSEHSETQFQKTLRVQSATSKGI